MSLPMNIVEALHKDRRYWDDVNWAITHIRELDGYPDQWVAIFNQKVVAHGKSKEEVRRDAMKVKGVRRPYMFRVECNPQYIIVN